MPWYAWGRCDQAGEERGVGETTALALSAGCWLTACESAVYSRSEEHRRLSKVVPSVPTTQSNSRL